jgi:hypothetical protein
LIVIAVLAAAVVIYGSADMAFGPREYANLTNGNIEATVAALSDADVIATYTSSNGGDNPLTCNGSVMPPGSTCVDRDTGKTVVSYDDWVAEQRVDLAHEMKTARDTQKNPLPSLIGSGIGVIVCLLVISGGIVVLRNRTRLAAWLIR